MEMLRRKTDYALRMMTKLGVDQEQGWVSTKDLAEEEDISYQLACKLMQKLQKTRYVNSRQGRTGGFELSKDSQKISLLDIIETIQGPLVLNKCLSDDYECGRESGCAVHKKLNELQEHINKYLADVSLADLVAATGDSQNK